MNGRAGWNWYFGADPQACPYIAGRTERRVVAALAPDGDPGLFDRLTENGFRRSQLFVYAAACPGCQACVSVRVLADAFRWSRGFKKVMAKNADLASVVRPARATAEQYELFRRYVGARHLDGGMADMDRRAFATMIDQAPENSVVVEHRDAGGALVAASLIDVVETGLSGVYKWFDPDLSRRSLGTFSILWMVRHAVERGLPYVYLGYWIEDCGKMAYKARFGPLERREGGVWRPFDPDA